MDVVNQNTSHPKRHSLPINMKPNVTGRAFNYSSQQRQPGSRWDGHLYGTGSLIPFTQNSGSAKIWNTNKKIIKPSVNITRRKISRLLNNATYELLICSSSWTLSERTLHQNTSQSPEKLWGFFALICLFRLHFSICDDSTRCFSFC